jgi:hypothetical protein
MKKISVFGVLTISLLLVATGLSCTIGKIAASLGQEVTISVGKTTIINSEKLKIQFVGVEGDSRCAKGVECVWAGEAKCRVIITYQGAKTDVVLTQSGGSVTQAYFYQYKASWRLEPYPESGKQITGSDYKLVMTVTK